VNGAHSRTLERALQVLKTKERLAFALDLPFGDIDAHLSGEKPLPGEAFILALEIVASRRGGR